jgi:hypothetical protein
MTSNALRYSLCKRITHQVGGARHLRRTVGGAHLAAEGFCNRCIAQLRAGYINPPEGYKSRRMRAQELCNKQLEEELADLPRLKEREQELQFELFKARLSAEDLERLEREAGAQVKPHLGLSIERQLAVHKDTILRKWFEQRGTPK